MKTSVPGKISTAALQQLLPNSQKPVAKPIKDCTHEERQELLTQAVRNIYNSYEESCVAYKDLAMHCLELLVAFHEHEYKRRFEEFGLEHSALWVKDLNSLEIAQCLLSMCNLGKLDTLYGCGE